MAGQMGDACLDRFQEILLCSQPWALPSSGTWQTVLSLNEQHIVQKEPKKARPERVFSVNKRTEHLTFFIPVPSHWGSCTRPQKHPDNQSKPLQGECAQRYPTRLVRLETGRGSFKLQQLPHSCTSTTGA